MTGILGWLGGMLAVPLGTVGGFTITFGMAAAAWLSWITIRWLAVDRLMRFIVNLAHWPEQVRRHGYNSAREQQAFERFWNEGNSQRDRGRF